MPDLARSFDDVATAYDFGRPRYDEHAIDAIAAAAGGGPRLLDVGAGTGRLSGSSFSAVTTASKAASWANTAWWSRRSRSNAEVPPSVICASFLAIRIYTQNGAILRSTLDA